MFSRCFSARCLPYRVLLIAIVLVLLRNICCEFGLVSRVQETGAEGHVVFVVPLFEVIWWSGHIRVMRESSNASLCLSALAHVRIEKSLFANC